ncbi:hypothetical protein MIND_00406100 [Mycena indigotica]|uniref:Uncharacterized protein n=1 Tax=Mycena indigotica TaxID=2126181 RepID=A0A8H6T3R1_9AGAR|nr:uncharacterized protein MIND_00406100 [Mycena indigotica]KAF7310320.1 hypothetical protein MIND_00406100 [Mycena indigotica]
MLTGPLIPLLPALAIPPLPVPQPQQIGDRSDDEDSDGGAVDGPQIDGEVTLARTYVRRVPRHLEPLAAYIRQPRFPLLVRQFLYEQLHPDMELPESLDELPDLSTTRFYTYNSARSIFHAPSDICGIGGMRREYIRATKSWFGGGARYDCVLVVHDRDAPGMQGMHVARVRLFFSFKTGGTLYPCALVHWFSLHGDEPDGDTGMWIVTPDWTHGNRGRQPELVVIHVDTILRAVHLMPVFGRATVPEENFDATDSLNAFEAFYVSKLADYHAHEIIY